MSEERIVHSSAIDFLLGEPNEKYDFIYIDPPYYSDRNFGEFDDRWNTVFDYVDSLVPALEESKRVLKNTGNICVHVDWHACHHVRVALERIYGEENFRNEIIWCYSSGGASSKHFSRKHDNLFVFSKNFRECKFNALREPYPRDYGNREGFHPEGRIMNDWWQIPILSTTSKLRNGYPTQKPIDLLKRLISAYTNEGDLVLDFYCGSGTTGEAAKQMRRKYVLVDINEKAISLCQKRLRECSTLDSFV